VATRDLQATARYATPVRLSVVTAAKAVRGVPATAGSDPDVAEQHAGGGRKAPGFSRQAGRAGVARGMLYGRGEMGSEARVVRCQWAGAALLVLGVSAAARRGVRALTRAERRVAVAILSGRTNAEIGRARGTSSRTIANQVASILRKLGVGSRYQLAAKLLGADGGCNGVVTPAATTVTRVAATTVEKHGVASDGTPNAPRRRGKEGR